MGLATESRTDKIRTERSSGVMPHFARVGEDVGASDGEAEGMALGDALGDEVGLGDTVGLAVGTFVGLTETLGEELGAEEGELEILGAADGTLVSTGGFVGCTGAVLPPPKTGERPSPNGGRVMPTLVGSAVPIPVSTIVGTSELVSLGCIEIDGNVEGAMETDGIGETDGRDEGMELIVGLGLMVGSAGILPEDGAILVLRHVPVAAIFQAWPPFRLLLVQSYRDRPQVGLSTFRHFRPSTQQTGHPHSHRTSTWQQRRHDWP